MARGRRGDERHGWCWQKASDALGMPSCSGKYFARLARVSASWIRSLARVRENLSGIFALLPALRKDRSMG